MSDLREKAIADHIEEHYPNAKMVNYYDKNADLTFYTLEELNEVDKDWFPLCCYKEEETDRVLYGGRRGVIHTYTEGETGAGKTTRFVIQSILALSSMKSKPSMVVVDNHGEINETTHRHLKEQGYDVKVINCDNPKKSDTYNPFYELGKTCLEEGELDSEAMDSIRRIADIIQPVESSHDPIWERGARTYTHGCILDKFEDLIKGDLPLECLTLYNVIQNHYWIREQITDSFSSAGDVLQIPHYRDKGTKAMSVQKMFPVTNSPDKTRASYFGVVESHYDSFGQLTMYMLSSSNTISISDFVNKPTVIIIQSGCTTVGDDLVSMLVNDIYTYIVKKGRDIKPRKLPRNIHCFLDEFANCNVARGKEYIKMLTTSRKFGMFWHMILQCDAQLNVKFGADMADVIRSNSTEIFLGSNDYDTQVRFARSCGKKTIESLASKVSQGAPHLETVDLITAEKLNLTEEGYAYVKTTRHPLLKTYIEAFYNCDNFTPTDSYEEIYPKNDFDYKKTAFYLDGSHLEDREEEEEPRPVRNFRLTRSERISRDKFFCEELNNHLDTQNEDEVNSVIESLTFVPKALKDLIGDMFSAKKDVTTDLLFSINSRMLKYEIIEEFIKNNDFDEKLLWEDRMELECKFLRESTIFPQTVLEPFEEALDDFKEEYTLTNIKEIKKLICDDSF